MFNSSVVKMLAAMRLPIQLTAFVAVEFLMYKASVHKKYLAEMAIAFSKSVDLQSRSNLGSASQRISYVR